MTLKGNRAAFEGAFGDVARQWHDDGSHAVWRRYCDALYRQLLDRWLAEPPGGLALKTDLFDEAVGGGLIDRLAVDGGSSLGVDASLEVASLARQQSPHFEPAVCDLRGLPFADSSLDLVFSNSTLDHFSDPADLQLSLRELARITRRDGVLILTLDNPHNPILWLRRVLPLSWLRRTGLVPYFVGATLSAGRLRRSLEQVGLEVRESCFLMHCLRVLAIPRAKRLRDQSVERQERFSSSLLAWERLESWPLARFSGHYVAVLAIRR